MTNEGEQILQHLARVAAERERRRRGAGAEAQVRAVKAYQHARFESTYQDLLSTPRYAKAARFFLDDLYGPHDFSTRDDQFARIVPPLVRLFPHDIVTTVAALAELHALSETLDTEMALALGALPVEVQSYQTAWRAVGRPVDRERQIVLMLAVGSALDRFTRNPLLRHSLRLMRAPAGAAGLGALQSFLEKGFETFREMRGAQAFLATIAERERALAAALFGDGSVADGTSAQGA